MGTGYLALNSSFAEQSVIFGETSAGRFSLRVDTTASTAFSFSGSSRRAVAVVTQSGYYIDKWNYSSPNNITIDEFGLLTYSGNSALTLRPHVKAGASNPIAVTVIDAHGTHAGTPTGTANYKRKSIFAVQHLANDPGYVFAGWKVTRSHTNIDILSTGYSGAFVFPPDYADAIVVQSPDSAGRSITFEALYQPGASIVCFSQNSPSVYGPAIPYTSIDANAAMSLPDPVFWNRPGYVFAGWNTAANGTGTAYAAGDLFYPPAGAVRLYAQWAGTAGDGAKANENNTYTAGSTHVYREEKLHYAIWLSSNLPEAIQISYQRRDHGTATQTTKQYQGGTTPASTTNTTLFSASDTITDTATIPADDPTEANIDNNAPVAYVAAPTYNDSGFYDRGYLLLYQFNRPNVSSNYYTTVEATLTTDTNDFWEWTAPEIANYDFLGWYTLSASISTLPAVAPAKADFTLRISPDRTITWGKLLFNLNSICTAYYWGDISDRTGHNFYKRYLNCLRLKYRGKKIVVMFAANGGDLTSNFWREVYYQETYGGAAGTLPTPVRDGYTFDGWYTAPVGGTLVTAATICSQTQTHTLYAHWTASVAPSEVNLLFQPAGGTCQERVRTLQPGDAFGTLPTPTKTGCTFDGWYTASKGGTLATAQDLIGNSSVTLYAHWTVTNPTPTPSPVVSTPWITINLS